MQSSHGTPTPKIRGVNLGGWLVLEKWMVPSLFEDLAATDETSWCAQLGPKAEPRLRRHWDSFVTEDDFAWLAQRGNAYRWSFFDPEGRAGIELGVYGVPETFFVAADGTLLAKHVGPLDADSLRGYLKTLFGVS